VLTACSTVFYQLVCHYPPCGRVFHICCHCYRGQRHCSSNCWREARRLQRQKANRRYEQSLGAEGREDHRIRQREYLQRLKARVTDQASSHPSSYARLAAPPALELVEAPPPTKPWLSPGAERAWSWVVCEICGCRARWIGALAEIKHVP